jgi:hypothetical protein
MNGDTTTTNQTVIQIVVIAIAVDATIGVLALGYCMVFGANPDATLLTAFVGLTGTLSGYLGGMLSRTSPTSATLTEPKPGTVTVPAQKLETETT